MLNSFSNSVSNAKSSSNSSSNVVNEIYDFKQIIRSNETSKFKKVNIHSKDFDLVTCNNPCILLFFTILKEDKVLRNNTYFYKYQEIKILSFNQITKEEMLIEYLIINEKEDTITIPLDYDYFHGQIYYHDIKDSDVLQEIQKKLLTNK